MVTCNIREEEGEEEEGEEEDEENEEEEKEEDEEGNDDHESSIECLARIIRAVVPVSRPPPSSLSLHSPPPSAGENRRGPRRLRPEMVRWSLADRFLGPYDRERRADESLALVSSADLRAQAEGLFRGWISWSEAPLSPKPRGWYQAPVGR